MVYDYFLCSESLSFGVRGTQALPFSRADVQMLPDTEALTAAAVKQQVRLH